MLGGVIKGRRPSEWTKSRFDRWLRDYPRATPIGVFLLVLALVVASAWSVEIASRRTARSAAEMQASEIASAIERRAAANSAYLQATSALFMSLKDVSPDFFRQFVDRLRVAYDLTGVVGLGWSEVVAPEDVAALEARMRAQGHESFRVHPTTHRGNEPLHVVTMLEPETPGNLAVLGFNMYSEARRMEAMDRARRTKAMAATDTVTLIQDQHMKAGKVPGFLVYIPVTSMGRQRFKGYVYSPVRIKDFIASALNPRVPFAGRIDIFDSTGKGQEQIYTTGGDGATLGSPVEQRLSVFDQQWLLRYHPHARPGFATLTLVVLVGGVSFALLLLAYVLLVQRRNEDLQALIAAQAEREAERAALVRELNHRVKNSLSNVTSIISLTRRNATDLDSFTSSLLERVRALAASHSLLDGAQWGPTDLKALIEAQVSTHDRADGRIRVDGPNILISPNDALSIGLALHELLTNATRYGALSNEDGRVSIRWTVTGADVVSVLWEEEGGPPVTAPEKRGFGLNLIERALARELGHPITIEFAPGGLRCSFAIGLREQRSFRLRQ
ncbi:MAG: CHASE domain-containing protein [Sphingomonas sp.]|nr:CHASE domain-containing protein [Sphingomonas sp.]